MDPDIGGTKFRLQRYNGKCIDRKIVNCKKKHQILVNKKKTKKDTPSRESNITLTNDIVEETAEKEWVKEEYQSVINSY